MILMSFQNEFMKILETAIGNKNAGNPHYLLRYCELRGAVYPIEKLEDFQCWNCPKFILNKGNCDPL